MGYTSRERCIRAIKREEVDMIPLNLWIDTPEPLNSLLKYLDLSSYEKLLAYLKVDYRGPPGITMVGVRLKGGFKEEVYKDEKGRILRRDIFGVVWALPLKEGHSIDIIHPLKEMDVEEYPWPEVDEESLDVAMEYRRKYEDYCIMGYTLQAFEQACRLFGFNEIFKRMIMGDKTVDKVLDKLFEITYTQAKLLLEAGVDEIYNGDDVGAQGTMLISPRLWRKYLKPRYKKLAWIIHSKGAFFHFHSDGWIEPIIPDLIEVGVDVLEPLQPETMDPAKIKREYGDKLSFEGAISIQKTLPFGTPEEVAEEARKRIEELGPTGYILRPSHTILKGTPLRNILTLYEAANKYRKVSQT
ncbi:MAG: hypothetical protein J7L11_09015 [Thermoprotei archaeon]|nr:hypothetical protein [Thermoprotei archaeon]